MIHKKFVEKILATILFLAADFKTQGDGVYGIRTSLERQNRTELPHSNKFGASDGFIQMKIALLLPC